MTPPPGQDNPDPFARDAPRYLIYPSPERFDGDVDQARFDRWAQALPVGAEVDLRILVPFCRKICWFCAYHAQSSRDPETLVSYADALTREIARAGRLAGGARVRTVGLAGGSPTELAGAGLSRVLDSVRAAFSGDGFELVCEIDAAGVARGSIEALLRDGLARARIGAQDFSPAVQVRIGRAQSAETTGRVIGWLRAGGAAIDVELLYGLPGQTGESIAATCERVIGFLPDRVSLAGYIHAPRLAKRQSMIREAEVPGAAARRDQHDRAADLLARAGYLPVGVDLHVHPGDPLLAAAAEGTLRRCRISGYGTGARQAEFGFGAGAISRFAQGFTQNATRTEAWVAAVASGGGAVRRGLALGLEDRLRARAIEMLLCGGALDLVALRHEFGDFTALVEQDIAPVANPRADGIPTFSRPDLARRAAMLLDRERRRGAAASP